LQTATNYHNQENAKHYTKPVQRQKSMPLTEVVWIKMEKIMKYLVEINKVGKNALDL